MTPLLRVAGVSKRFGAQLAVDAVSFDVAPASFFALLGPSGCGKTTLLRLIAGFETPDQGALTLNGTDLAGVPPNRRPLNLMFQSYALFPHMTVAANVAYGLECEGLARSAIAPRVADALAMVKLTDLGARKPGQLSGGQRQRVALARALVKRPQLLLLDEPLGALDKSLRGDMQIELKLLQRDTGIAFLVVTHDQEEALSMADQVCLLDQGRVVQIDTPERLYEHPANRFAAGFIGRTNFLPGRCQGDRIDLDGLGPHPVANPGAVRDGPAVLAVRPERLRLWDAPDSGRHAVSLTGLAYLGADIEARLRLPTGQDLHARLSAAAPAAALLASPGPLYLDWPADHARLLA